VMNYSYDPPWPRVVERYRVVYPGGGHKEMVLPWFRTKEEARWVAKALDIALEEDAE